MEPEQTLLYMHTLSLLPDKTLAKLDARLGARFRSLSESQRLALVEVELEGSITHSRFKEISSGHARDLTLALQALVREGFLASDGGGKKSRYFFPDQLPDGSPMGAPHAAGSSQHLPGSSQHLETAAAATEEEERRLLDSLPANLKPTLLSLRRSAKAPKPTIRDAVLQLCSLRPFALKELATILDRAPLTLQNHHLSELVREGRLVLRYPDKPSHPDQAYLSAVDRNEGNVA
ncbi:MAG TPA: hypothetical protein VK465_06040 [Fibrobacteria bacterium]|nr:hypothetical protein [Fibrobacteria bacterium]